MARAKLINGRYRIESQLGEGGMGVVSLAYDTAQKRPVAIKTLRELSDEYAIELFYKECDLLKSISHPNIVEIFDSGEFYEGRQKKPFFVMPLLKGVSFDRLIADAQTGLPIERVISIVAQACRGLQAAHEAGLIHRDIKPSNIFVMPDDSVKIIDFGVARSVNSHSISVGFQKGTLLYMSPEQVQYKPVTAQSDIFSLGVVCYEALTRRHPFGGTNEEEISERILKSNPVPISELNPAVSYVLGRAVHKALAKNAHKRYDAALEFAETLHKAARNEFIPAFDPELVTPRLERARKALASGDHRFAQDILDELAAEGNLDSRLQLLRAEVEHAERVATLNQLLQNAKARYEDHEYDLARHELDKLLKLQPHHAAALSLKNKIDSRIAESDVDKWLDAARLSLAAGHYSQARSAIERVSAIRPGDPRAAELSAAVAAEEESLIRARTEQGRRYQLALTAWTNGDVDAALELMTTVMDLEHHAPDSEASSSYRDFFTKLREEHDAISSGCAQVRALLEQGDLDRASDVCVELLKRHPGHSLLEALKLEIDDRQREHASGVVAAVSGRLENEPDLDRQIELLRQALREHPHAPFLEQALQSATAKKERISALIAKARRSEQGGLFDEAISALQAVQRLAPTEASVQSDIERLQQQRAQRSLESASRLLSAQIARAFAAHDYDRARSLLEKVPPHLVDQPSIAKLQAELDAALHRVAQAADLRTQGETLCQQGDFEGGLAFLRQARTVEPHDARNSAALRDALIEYVRHLLPTDVHRAAVVLGQAVELGPPDDQTTQLQAELDSLQQREAVQACVDRVNQLKSAGELGQAVLELVDGLARFPTARPLLDLKQLLEEGSNPLTTPPRPTSPPVEPPQQRPERYPAVLMLLITRHRGRLAAIGIIVLAISAAYLSWSNWRPFLSSPPDARTADSRPRDGEKPIGGATRDEPSASGSNKTAAGGEAARPGGDGATTSSPPPTVREPVPRPPVPPRAGDSPSTPAGPRGRAAASPPPPARGSGAGAAPEIKPEAGTPDALPKPPEVTSPPPGPGTVEKTAPEVIAGRGAEGPAAPSPSPPPPPRIDVQAARAGIVLALRRFQAGYGDKNIDAIRRVYPSADENTIFKSKSCSGVRVEFGEPHVTMLSAESALVDVPAVYGCKPRTGQREQTSSAPDSFQMIRKGDVWIITRWLTPVG